MSWEDSAPVELLPICELFGCEVVELEGLSDRTALAYLQDRFGMDPGDEPASTTALAGGLYIAGRGVPRWIFVERRDGPERQRFTVAHELGHLFVEAEPAIAASRVQGADLFSAASATALKRFSRCAHVAVDPRAEAPQALPQMRAPRPVWTPADLLEIQANHFAAELLMPFSGVKQLIARRGGLNGVRDESDLERLVDEVAATYHVSHASARQRLRKDLGIVPVSRSANMDLFL